MKSCKKRNRPGNKWDELRKKHSPYSIFFKKYFTFFEHLWIQKTIIGTEKSSTISITEIVIDHVSKKCSHNRSKKYSPDRQYPQPYEDTCWDEDKFPIPEKSEWECCSKKYTKKYHQIHDMWMNGEK